AVNNDGALKVGYTAPSVAGQAQVIAAAQAMAGVKPEWITYVEAHGTGTKLGDPIEIAALSEAFAGAGGKRGDCAIGTVKSNLGHLDAAAGLTGLVKTVLALEHREIRPSLHFQRPSPAIDFAASPFYVADRLTPWLDTDRLLRLAGVSSFGIGGTNAHVVVEEAPASPAPDPSRALQMLVLSAKSSLALEQMTDNLVEHLDGHPELCLADVAFTLLEGRARWHHRRALVCHDLADARSALALRDPERILTQAPDGAAGRVVFLFPGTGAQYAGMGRELYRSEPVFKQELDRCLDVLAPRLKCDLRPVFELERESSAGTLLLRRT